MDWYTREVYMQQQQMGVEKQARHYWKYSNLFRLKKVHERKLETDRLYGKAVHVLQEMLESDNAQHRLQAADIVMRHSIKHRGKMTFSN